MTTSSRNRSRRRIRPLTAASVALLSSTVASSAWADAPAVDVDKNATTITVAPTGVSDPSLAGLGREVDAALSDAARDLGFRTTDRATANTEVHATLVVAPSNMLDLHVVRAPLHANPDAPERRVEKRVPRGDAAIEAVVLLRALLRGEATTPFFVFSRTNPSGWRAAFPGATIAAAPRPIDRLGGRITLMTSAGVLGGVVGFSIQSASGSEDARLLVPLTLVGAGIGIGAAYLASGEWDVTPADAWFFTAGATWGTVAGHLVFQGRFAADRESSDRWVFGLVGGGLGATLATVGLTLHPMTDAGALLANAGGAGGLAIGSLVELAVNAGRARSTGTEAVPCTGMGYGAALGWLVAATVAVNVRPRWLDKPLVRTPFVGVLGVSGASGDKNGVGILGLGYGGSLTGLPGPFHL